MRYVILFAIAMTVYAFAAKYFSAILVTKYLKLGSMLWFV